MKIEFKSRYLVFAAILVAQLCVNVAQADEWLYTRCSGVTVGKDVPEYFAGLREVYWGANLTKQSSDSKGLPVIKGVNNIVTNLGIIYEISLDEKDNMVYPMFGKRYSSGTPLDPGSDVRIEKPENGSNYIIYFTSDYSIANKKVTTKSSMELSGCKTEMCRCKGKPEEKTNLTASPPQQPMTPNPDPQEKSTTGICSTCALL